MNKFVKYTFGAVALYLVAKNASNVGTLLKNGASGYATGIKALQGR